MKLTSKLNEKMNQYGDMFHSVTDITSKHVISIVLAFSHQGFPTSHHL